MTENKTKISAVEVSDYLANLSDDKMADSLWLIDRMQNATGEAPKMWGPSIIGYGSYGYKYESGREGTSARAGFSPRKAQLVIYLMGTYADRQAEADALFAKLGKHKTGASCLYITKLADVDLGVLEQLVVLSWEAMNAKYPT